MTIQKDHVVSFHYQLIDTETGAVLENSRKPVGNEPAHPSLYLHGHDNLLPSLEAAMNGANIGDNVSVTLEAKDAYGPRKEGASTRIAKKHLINKGRLQAGMTVQVKTSQGPQDAVLLKVGLKTVDIDSNHPYAGKTLTFDVEVMDIRAATDEELAHGRAHGVGGHQH